MRKVFLILFWLAACSPDGPHKPVGESGGSGEFSTAGYDSVKPIFAQYCAACHPSRSGPDWLDYSQASTVARSGKLFRRIAQERSMPPPGTSQAAAISDSERLAIASWARAGGPKDSREGRASGPPTPEPTPQQKLVQNCLRCHGASGPDPSAQPRIPLLAGQNQEYLVNQLYRFKWSQRIDPTQEMNGIAIVLSDAEIVTAAQYFASRDSHISGGGDVLKDAERDLFLRGQRIAARDCESCHRNSEFKNRPTISKLPALAGQSKIYLINQIVYFRDARDRANPLMRKLAHGLTNQDIEALAVYFANVR
jgi:cytochrome c553